MEISVAQFIAQLTANLDYNLDCDQKVRKYLGWNKLDPGDEKELQYVGSLPTQGLDTNDSSSNNEYWSATTPIVLSKYPYYGCNVYKDKICDSFYFVYTEYGGHAPEKRCRFIQKDLIQL